MGKDCRLSWSSHTSRFCFRIPCYWLCMHETAIWLRPSTSCEHFTHFDLRRAHSLHIVGRFRRYGSWYCSSELYCKNLPRSSGNLCLTFWVLIYRSYTLILSVAPLPAWSSLAMDCHLSYSQPSSIFSLQVIHLPSFFSSLWVLLYQWSWGFSSSARSHYRFRTAFI